MNDPFATGGDNSGPDADSGEGGNFIGQLPAILWQRRWWIVIPAVLGTIGALVALFVIKPLYKSEAIMLVESRQLPSEVLVLDDSELIDRRMARIKQQVTARPDLISLIEKHGLYAKERRNNSLSSVVSDMREAITIVPTLAAGTRNGDDNTIAFVLSFSYSQPVLAQAVTQDLMNQILQLDSQGNVEQANNTVEFLTEQGKTLETQIAEIQGQITSVMAANSSSLAGGNVTVGNSASFDVQIAALLRDNQQLVSQRALAGNSDQRDPIVIGAEQQLAAALAVYSENHPDVAIARQRLAEAKRLAKNNVERIPVEMIDSQIAFNNAQISALRAAKASEDSNVRQRLDAQARAPVVQQKIADLQQNLSALTQQQERVQTQLNAARAGVRAEDEQMAERLVVVEPPVVPEDPFWPDRLLLALAGIGGGLALGLTLALAVEMFLQPLRDPASVRRITGLDPIGVIPVISFGPKGQRRKWRLPFWKRKTAGYDLNGDDR